MGFVPTDFHFINSRIYFSQSEKGLLSSGFGRVFFNKDLSFSGSSCCYCHGVLDFTSIPQLIKWVLCNPSVGSDISLTFQYISTFDTAFQPLP